MLSEKQMIANRNNALRSTGPKSFEGKRIVARNAVRHGLLSSPDLTVIKGEDCTEFEEFSGNLLADLKPVGQLETLLAERITSFFWRLKRTGRMEKELLDLLTVPAQSGPVASNSDDKPILNIITKMYLNALEDQEYQDFLVFKKAQIEMAGIEASRGRMLSQESAAELKKRFELPSPSSAPAAVPQVVEPEALGKAVKQDFKSEKLLDKLLRYEGQIERSMYRAMLELNKLQFIRTRSEALTAEVDNAESSPPFQGGVPQSGEGVLACHSRADGRVGSAHADNGAQVLSFDPDSEDEGKRGTGSVAADTPCCTCPPFSADSVAEASSFGSDPDSSPPFQGGLSRSDEGVLTQENSTSDSSNEEKPNKPILEIESCGASEPQTFGCDVSVIPSTSEESIENGKLAMDNTQNGEGVLTQENSHF